MGRPKEMNGKMKVITCNIPESWVRLLDIMADLGIYSSRSDVIRDSLRKALPKILKQFKEIKREMNFSKTVRTRVLQGIKKNLLNELNVISKKLYGDDKE